MIKNNKRLLSFGILATIIIFSLSLRLYYLQIHQNSVYSSLALKQRSKEISLFPKRGMIYDRNLLPLTNSDTRKMMIVPTDLIKDNKYLYDLLLKNTSLNYNEFFNALSTSDYILQIPVTNEFHIENKPNNIFFTEVVNRYDKNNLLSHVIGYINKSENTGEYGIEKVFDEYLSKNDEKSLIIEYDKSRTIILDGAEYVNEITDPNNPAAVKLTIDKNIQTIVENTMDEKKVNGAIIVAEIESGNILAMASRPNFNQDEVHEYLKSDDMTLYNKATQVAYPPGSIFKLVVLLAALESNYDFTDEEFFCPGYEDVNGLRIKCTNIHGYLNLEEGFAKSCNSVFIQLGKKLGAKTIIDLASRLNFGKRINIGLIEEIQGLLPKDDDLLGPAIGNISIGQGKIEATPLQITNLLMTIANNGIQKPLTIIEGITNKDGKMLKIFNKETSIAVINSSIANIAYDYLVTVVEEGTAKFMDLEILGGAGGKTGSAEAILNKNSTIHGWFSGFLPKRNPKYVITVLVEEGYSGSKSAAPIFEIIAKEINNIYPLY